ncbi:MAG TPA: efflux RND transporter permease subunit [Ignavibacteriaceae bacterium]|nr:efflux RND transporter permease subunit [Ignavibacteriaceae bacterium]
MKLLEYAVKFPQMTMLFAAMLVLIGISTIINMPRSEDPELSAPDFPIVIVYPGASPEDLEELVVDPIEQEVSSLENIKEIRTTIRDGLAVIDVVYQHGVDVDEKYQEVIREVNNMRNELPAEIYNIDIQKWLPSNVNVIQAALISENASFDMMKEYSENFEEELEKLPMLKNVDIHGLPDKIIRVELKLDKIGQMHIPLNAVLGSIQSEAVNIPGGSADAGTQTFNIQTNGSYENIEEIKNTIVYSVNGKNILLRDIANVYFDFEKPKYVTRLNSHRCVFVAAALKPNENITAAQKIYSPVINNFKATLPSNIDLVQNFDQADNVNNRLSGLGIDFMIAIALVSITLLPLGYRAAIIVMISIPLSLSMGVTLINLLGINLNQLSIVGFVVALGLLVDDSIVVVENIERWLREGHTRLEAVLKGTRQIALAVVGCTLTLIIAFFPFVLLPGASGDFIRSLPAAVIASVLSSMVVSLTIIPFLSSILLREEKNPEGNIFLRGLKKVISGSYSVVLNKALNRPIVTTIIAGAIFAASLMLFPVIGFSLFPPSEKPQFLIDITAPPQSNLDYTDFIAKKIELELKKYPDIKYFASNIGRGNPQIYYNVLQKNEQHNFAQLFVQLDEHTNRSHKAEIIEELRKKWTPFTGAKIEVKNFEQGPPVIAPVEVRMFGDNLDSLRMLSSRIEDMLKNTEGTIYIENPLRTLKSDIQVDINKEKAGMLSVSTGDINKTVRLAAAGFNLGKMTDDDGNDYDILITKEKNDLRSLDAFDNLFVNNYRGTAIPLNQLSTLKLKSSPSIINHRDKIRTVSVSAFVKEGYLNDNVINVVKAKMDNLNLPAGYTFEMGGEIEQREESFGGLTNIIIATIFMFIAVLLLEFKTFKSTLIVLSVIPLGIVGAVLALLLTGNSLSFVAVIGLIALAGIEVKNTILLVDFTNQLREEGRTLDEAIREAGELRFLPIILTSLTAIGGLLPIALSDNPLISPLAIVIIGGLISSTILSRLVTPVVYKLIPPKIK